MKKVLLVVIDALATRVVEPAIAEGRLPTLAALARQGVFRPNSTSIFPSITPAATASLVTGCYPAEHGIAGAFWYERDQNRIAYYGDDVWVVMNEGFGEYFDDFLIKLNFERLQADTLFERVEQSGGTAAVLNYMWFRGGTEHDVNAPLLLKLLPGVEFVSQIRGPKIAAIADFVTTTLTATGEPLSASGGLLRRFGFHDETTGEYLLQLADSGALPDFTLSYFPNNDFESHEHGPQEALSTVERVDEILGSLVDQQGGMEAFLRDMAIIVTGDHSQCDMAESEEERRIDLNEVLDGLQLVPAGGDWRDDDDLMACPNLRAAQIYFPHSPSTERRQDVIGRLLAEPRIDQVLRAEPFRGAKACRFHVHTHDRGRLSFCPADTETEPDCVDVYGNRWLIDGDISAIDARIDGGNVQYGDYPNALERIANAFCETCGDLWVTARPGSELCVPETSIHPGGSHGSLHALDSTSPLIVAGCPDHVSVPDHPRTVDITPLCLEILEKTG